MNDEVLEGTIGKIYLIPNIHSGNGYEPEILLSENENEQGLTPKYGCTNIPYSYIKTIVRL